MGRKEIMKKLIIRKPGGYDQLEFENVLDLVPNENEIIVQVKAIGVNYADIIIRWGLYESAKKFVGWPITPGFEYSGVVCSIGENIKKFKVGDKVLGCTLFNAYAEQVKTTEEHLFNLPSKWSFSQGAGMAATFLTAYHALFQIIVIQKKSKILIHSAAGGVGTALLQMGKIKGFEMVGVVGSSHKVDTAKKFGANYVIDKTKENWVHAARDFSPSGYDVILDANGVTTLRDSWKLLNSGGKLMIYGFHSMFPKSGGRVNYIKLVYDYLRTPSFNPLKIPDGNRSICFFNLSFLWSKKELLSEAMSQILEWINSDILKPPGITEFTFEEVKKAHELIESGQSTGKIVLLVHK